MKAMSGTFSTAVRLMEQLAVNGEVSVSQLARVSGISYPTTLYAISSFPFVSRRKVGRECKVEINEEYMDAVYPFLVALQTSETKRAQLTLSFLSRKGFGDLVIGGEMALELQLPVKDAEPDPQVEVRTANANEFKKFVCRTLPSAIASDFLSKVRIVEDGDTAATKRIGLLLVSRPEKLLVDSVAEKQSEVFIESVAEAIVNSSNGVDIKLLRLYASRRGVLEEVLQQMEKARGSNFP
jgi:hypothetical protein